MASSADEDAVVEEEGESLLCLLMMWDAGHECEGSGAEIIAA